MSALSEREQRILNEIEAGLAGSGRTRWWPYRWLPGLVAILLGGYGMLAVGLIQGSVPLIVVGIPLAQFSPLAAGYLYRRRSRVLIAPGAGPGRRGH
jgi:hypothetical protein